MIGGWVSLFMSVTAIRRIYSGVTALPARTPAEQSCPVSHGHVVADNIYCVLLRFLWFVMQRKLTDTESPEQLLLARTKGTDLKSS